MDIYHQWHVQKAATTMKGRLWQVHTWRDICQLSQHWLLASAPFSAGDCRAGSPGYTSWLRPGSCTATQEMAHWLADKLAHMLVEHSAAGWLHCCMAAPPHSGPSEVSPLGLTSSGKKLGRHSNTGFMAL
jgi:hypothetical protein